MTIQASAQPVPIVPVSVGLPATQNADGTTSFFTKTVSIALQQMRNFIVNTCRTIPCNASMASNVVTLTMLPSQPDLLQYASYDAFAFVAPATSTGALTALVVTENGSLATLKVYKNTGTQAGSGDLVINGLYRLTYNDASNGGAGGFVIDGNGAAVLTALTNSSGGVVSNTIVPVVGTPDDTDINNNFASLASKVNAMMAALGMS